MKTNGDSTSIIKLATRRLEELRRAGVDGSWNARDSGTPDDGMGKSTATRAGLAFQAKPARQVPLGAAADADSSPHAARSRSVHIDLERLQAEGYVMPGVARNGLADEFRLIKRPLLRNAPTLRRGNLIQVTSALPGEGKTFTAINLALSISMELDNSVLLVDADCIRPTVFSRLGLSADLGLMDILRDPSIPLPDVLLRTNIPKLTLLSSGTGGANSTELLASGSMEALLDELALRYSDRIIIFDTPPLLPTTESRVLAAHVGQVVVVVAAGSTRRELVAETFSKLSNCSTVLPLLNKYVGPPLAGPYGYYE